MYSYSVPCAYPAYVLNSRQRHNGRPEETQRPSTFFESAATTALTLRSLQKLWEKAKTRWSLFLVKWKFHLLAKTQTLPSFWVSHFIVVFSRANKINPSSVTGLLAVFSRLLESCPLRLAAKAASYANRERSQNSKQWSSKASRHKRQSAALS